jgi:hypothetical protein
MDSRRKKEHRLRRWEQDAEENICKRVESRKQRDGRTDMVRSFTFFTLCNKTVEKGG